MSSSEPSERTIKRTGTQSLERAILILRELGTRGATGWGLWDLADRCGLDRGTTHRILSCLVRERVIHQRKSDRHYFLGPLIYELSVTLAPHRNFQKTGRSVLLRLSRRFKSFVAVLYLRTGNDCVCIAREGKSQYTRDNTGVVVGYVAPMMSLAGGVAILAALPKDEGAMALERNTERLQHLGRERLRQTRKLVTASAKDGYVFSEGVVWQGVNSFSVAVANSRGEIVGSIALSGTAADCQRSRAMEIVPVLREAADSLVADADALLRE